ncbi:MAG: aminotransferase class V-fold PLP-dependent enzyme [Myxococcales bacterium]|nr:aminotransferase class V-fold PLP-dependent enzyme [Myxococcales bacterium]
MASSAGKEGFSLAHLWQLDAAVCYLNHGSFGACPTAVLDTQRALRDRMERQPTHFMLRELPALLDVAREELGRFVGAESEGLAFVTNATSGVNHVLRSLELQPGDELLTTDHAYGACRNALDFVAQAAGAQVVVAQVPFPIASADAVVEAVLGACTGRTRLALLDHVTSPSGLVFPLERLVPELEARGVATLVDGAHAPGMLELEVAGLGASYYVGNCHKWLCAPKSVGFLYTREDARERIRPLVISHGATAPLGGRSRYHLELDWQGTTDPTPALCVPEAIHVLGAVVQGGWPAIRARNHGLALRARERLCDVLGIAVPSPADMIGSMAALPLPALEPAGHALERRLLEEHAIEVPIRPWPGAPHGLLRISAQLYNHDRDYERLAEVLGALRRPG